MKVFASSATNGGSVVVCGGNLCTASLYLGCIARFVFSHFVVTFAFLRLFAGKEFCIDGDGGSKWRWRYACSLTGSFLILN